MSEKFTCPRRVEQGLHLDDSPLVLSGSNKDEWEHDGTCSYCGSLSEDRFFRAIDDGVKLTPTDKSYKVYVAVTDVRGAGKFYFQHLSDGGRDRFIELHNAKKMTLGMPGHFYVRPFFCSPAEAQS